MPARVGAFKSRSIGGFWDKTTAVPLSLPTCPFISTGVQLWYDTTYTSFISVDTNVSSTIGFITDLTGNGYDCYQGVKEFQPALTSDGAFFNGATVLNVYQSANLVRNVNKYYMACVMKVDTVGVGAAGRQIIQINKNTGTTTNRSSFLLSPNTSGHKLRCSGSVNDGTESSTAIATAQQANSVFSYGEMSVDLSANTVDFWVNGTHDSTLSSVFATTGSTPNNDPLGAYFGNAQNQGSPFLGSIRALIIQVGGLATGQQASIQTYLASKAV